MRCSGLASANSRRLDRKKLLADPVMIFAIIVVLAFLLLFVVYPLCTILTQSFETDYPNTLISQGQRITSMAKQDESLKENVIYLLGSDCANYANEYKRGQSKQDAERMAQLGASIEANLAAIEADPSIAEEFVAIVNAAVLASDEEATQMSVDDILDVCNQLSVAYKNIGETHFTLEV